MTAAALHRSPGAPRRGRAAAHRRGHLRRRHRPARACCTPASCAARSPRAPASAPSTRRAALALPGVHAVFTAADLNRRRARAVVHGDGQAGPGHPAAAARRRRGALRRRPVALVVAADRYLAEDAAELVDGRVRAAAGRRRLHDRAARGSAGARGLPGQRGRLARRRAAGRRSRPFSTAPTITCR